MLCTGDRIVVKDRSKSYGGRYAGCTGEVTRGSFEGHYTVAVELTGIRNPSSSYGYFWFKERELEKVKYEQEANFMLDGYAIARIKNFENGTEHNYALYNKGVKADDIVVAAVNGIYEVGKVVAVWDASEDCKPHGNREVVCLVYEDEYKERKQREKEMRQLKAEMDKRVESLQAVALYELMAEKDPSLREMLEKFKNLSQGV